MIAEGMSGRLGSGFGMITAQRAPRDRRSADLYADAIDLCVVAEQFGFDAAWLAEHHFIEDGYMPSLLPLAAAIAARTSALAASTGILVAPLHEPGPCDWPRTPRLRERSSAKPHDPPRTTDVVPAEEPTCVLRTHPSRRSSASRSATTTASC